MSILQIIASTLVAPLVFTLGLAGYKFSDTAPVQPAPQVVNRDTVDIESLRKQISELQALTGELKSQPLGTSPFVPNAAANFVTSLASSIGASDTTMTLVSFTTKDGTSLITGRRYGFTIDEGLSNEEHVIGTAAASNQVTSLIRGISVNTGTTTISALKSTHRRGATVQITNAPLDIIMRNIVDGRDFLPNLLIYSSTTPACTLNDGICDKEYIDSTANAGASDANQTTKGISEEATTAEINSGTQNGGTGARLFVNPNDLSTSNYANFLPSTTQKDALSGATGTPSTSNRYLTQSNVFFGGTGSDGALSVTTGTTTIDAAGAAVVTKNYTSISITGGKLRFVNPHPNGTFINLKSQGNCTITSATAKAIDASGMGAATTTRGIVSTGSFTNRGIGSASSTSVVAGASGIASTTPHFAAGYPILANGSGGGNSFNPVKPTTLVAYGGRGGGSVYMECGGSWNFTTTGGVSVQGTGGQDGTWTGGGGGGGGGGGSFLALYNSMTANTGTVLTSGGKGGNAQGAGGAGGAGGTGTGSGTSGTGGAGQSDAPGGAGGGSGGGSFSGGAGSAGASGGGSATGGGGGGGAGGSSSIMRNIYFIH